MWMWQRLGFEMHILYDEDEYETVVHSRLCTTCGGNLHKCRGVGCNGSGGISSRRRSSEEIAGIKAARQLAQDKELIKAAEAALLRMKSRGNAPPDIDRLAADLAQFTD